LKGASQPRIGAFSIPLGEYIIETSKELKKRIDTLTAFYRANQEEFLKTPAIKGPEGQDLASIDQVEIVVEKEVLESNFLLIYIITSNS